MFEIFAKMPIFSLLAFLLLLVSARIATVTGQDIGNNTDVSCVRRWFATVEEAVPMSSPQLVELVLLNLGMSNSKLVSMHLGTLLTEPTCHDVYQDDIYSGQVPLKVGDGSVSQGEDRVGIVAIMSALLYDPMYTRYDRGRTILGAARVGCTNED